MSRLFLMLAALAALLTLGCGGNTPYSPAVFGGTVAPPTSAPTPTPGPGSSTDTFPDFNITAPSTFPAPTPGTDGILSVALTVRTNAAVGSAITLALQNPPVGVSATFSPATVSPSSSPIPVAMTLKVSDSSKPGSVQVVGKSGTIERLAQVNYSAYVAPTGLSIAIVPVAGQSNGSRTREFDVTLSQTTGSGDVFMDIDRSDLTGGSVLVPLKLPTAATVTGLPNSVTLPSGTTMRTFRLTVTLPADTLNFYYGFGVYAERGGRRERAATELLYAGESTFTVSSNARVSGNTDTVELTYTPKSASFNGTLVLNRATDGTLVDAGGTTLASLPAGTTVTGLPQTLTFDGTGTSRKATFTVTAPAGTPSITYYGIRVRATSPGSEASTESVTLLQFGIGGG